MGIYTKELNESFKLEESYNNSIETNRKILDESYWDMVAPLIDGNNIEEPIEESFEETTHNVDPNVEEKSNQNSFKEPDNFTTLEALNMYENLREQNMSPDEAKAKVLSESKAYREALKEDSQLTRRERLEREKQKRLKSYVEAFRKQNDFSLDEELTEEKLKYHTMQIKEHAVRHGIPSAEFKEALIKGIN